MANGRNKIGGRKVDSGRDSGGFVALPWAVLDSPAYARLSHPARALLLEFARQFVRDNNGRLLASFAYLSPRGWKSKSLIQRARDELMAAGFVYETAKGQRPSKAAWYAVSWHALDRLPGYDPGAAESFVRSAYKNAILSPSTGARKRRTAPSYGAMKALSAPSYGAVMPVFDDSSAPSYGHHLDKPSTGQFLNEDTGRVGRASADAAEPQSEPEKCGRPARK